MRSSSLDRLRVVCRTSGLPEPVMADLAAAFAVRHVARDAPARDLVAADVVLVTVDSRLDAATLEALPERVGAVATYSVGLDHIDLAAAARRGLAVFNTPGVLADSVAETALLLILGAARRVTESVALVRSGAWPGWTACQLNGMELAGKTLGVLGMGEIGRAAAARARAFGLEIAYTNRRRLSPQLEDGARFVSDPRDLVRDCDVLLLTAPSAAETRGLVNAELLALAKPGLILVNVARGDLVVDDDLIAALRTGQVGAAGLDVYNNEPRFDPRYLDLPNVFMLPHIGSSTLEARRRMGRALVAGLEAWRRGETPANRIV